MPDGEGPHPLIVFVHGGPVWAYRDRWSMGYVYTPLLGRTICTPVDRVCISAASCFASLRPVLPSISRSCRQAEDSVRCTATGRERSSSADAVHVPTRCGGHISKDVTAGSASVTRRTRSINVPGRPVDDPAFGGTRVVVVAGR